MCWTSDVQNNRTIYQKVEDPGKEDREETKEKTENLNNTINQSDISDTDGILQLTIAGHTVSSGELGIFSRTDHKS